MRETPRPTEGKPQSITRTVALLAGLLVAIAIAAYAVSPAFVYGFLQGVFGGIRALAG
jgi:hypothetical protein